MLRRCYRIPAESAELLGRVRRAADRHLRAVSLQGLPRAPTRAKRWVIGTNQRLPTLSASLSSSHDISYLLETTPAQLEQLSLSRLSNYCHRRWLDKIETRRASNRAGAPVARYSPKAPQKKIPKA